MRTFVLVTIALLTLVSRGWAADGGISFYLADCAVHYAGVQLCGLWRGDGADGACRGGGSAVSGARD